MSKNMALSNLDLHSITLFWHLKFGRFFWRVFVNFWAGYRPSYLATLALILNMGAEKNTHRKRSNVVCETGLTVKNVWKYLYLIQRQCYRCQACYGNERIPRNGHCAVWENEQTPRPSSSLVSCGSSSFICNQICAIISGTPYICYTYVLCQFLTSKLREKTVTVKFTVRFLNSTSKRIA